MSLIGMWVRYNNITKRILSISPEELSVKDNTTVVFVDWLDHMNLNHIYVNNENEVKPYSEEQIEIIEQRIFNNKKDAVLKNLENRFKEYILHYYPQIKQDSDSKRIDYHESALLYINSSYTVDQLKRDTTQYINDILSGTTTLEAILATKDENEHVHWQQGILSAIRTTWFVRNNYVYDDIKSQIENATNDDELNGVDRLEDRVFPYFLPTNKEPFQW